MESFSAGEFLQGFLEEADEHLRNINHHLLRLEEDQRAFQVGEDFSDTLNELFRSFHTLKGLSSMVGLSPAAVLSHSMETVLQGLQKGQIELSEDLLDRLFAGTHTLSHAVDTLRNPDLPMPDIHLDVEALDPWISSRQGLEQQPGSNPSGNRQKKARGKKPAARQEKPRAVTSEADAEVPAADAEVIADDTASAMLPGLAAYPDMLNSLEQSERRKIRQAVDAGASFALVVFIPSGERAARGENVDLIRSQLNELGTIIKAVPVMVDGSFRFLFLVAGEHTWDSGPVLADEIIPLAAQVFLGLVEKKTPYPAQAHPSPDKANPRRLTGPVVRVELARLDELMYSAGNLVTLRSRLEESITKLNGVPRPVQRELVEIDRQLARALRNLRRSILRARMVPLREVFAQMPLVVRDLARTYQKEVRLVLQGEEIEVDKLLVERLLDPLIHLVRNAITHGIEMPAERTAVGKQPTGMLTLRGIPQGDRFRIELQDDGRGIDIERVTARAQALGWLPPGQQPGFGVPAPARVFYTA
jgi:two-component system, chemotaxis family, sensor kinase CheA